jgi:hypothetical protein
VDEPGEGRKQDIPDRKNRTCPGWQWLEQAVQGNSSHEIWETRGDLRDPSRAAQGNGEPKKGSRGSGTLLSPSCFGRKPSGLDLVGMGVDTSKRHRW